MYQILRELFGQGGGAPGGLRASEPEAFRLACAVLLVEIMRAEPDVTETERQAVLQALRRRFPLGDGELQHLVASAEEASRSANDFHRFTSELNEHLDAPSKASVMETLWSVAYADGQLGDHENHCSRASPACCTCRTASTSRPSCAPSRPRACRSAPTRPDRGVLQRRPGVLAIMVAPTGAPMDPKPQAKDAGRGADATIEKQRDIQREQDRKDEAKAKGREEGGSQPKAVQTGRPQPEELPAQHMPKPGIEADMELKPRFLAPDYRGSGKLQDMVAIVTGGDSGIGRSVAVLYAREGADVAIVYLHSTQDAEETKRHVEKEGRRCLLVQGDVKDSAFCKEAVERTVREFGKLDILVNNAAFQEHADSLADITDERLDETMRTNIFGYFYMARAALPHLGRGASIINTGSVVGIRGSGQLLDYSATKGAIHAFTMSLASSVIGQGIRVNCVAPGPVWTPLNPADQTAENVAKFGKSSDFKRPAQPEELSPAYVFLAAPSCASYITGLILPVTGNVGGI